MVVCLKCDTDLRGSEEHKINTLIYAICRLCGKVYVKDRLGNYTENRRRDLPPDGKISWPEMERTR